MNLYNDNIKFIHYRRMDNNIPLARGGMTIAYFVNDDGTVSYESSRCSDKDNFSYAEGRKWAVTRLKRPFVMTKKPAEFRRVMDAFATSVGFGRVYSRKNKTGMGDGAKVVSFPKAERTVQANA